MATAMNNDMRFWLRHFDDVPYVVTHAHGLTSPIPSLGGKRRAGCGVFFGSGHPLNSAFNYEGRQTVHASQLISAIVALRLVRWNSGQRRVLFKINSWYVIEAACYYRPRWAKNGWRSLRDGKELRNKELLKTLFDEMDKFDKVLFVHVDSSDGGRGFRKAVELAQVAIEDCKTRVPQMTPAVVDKGQATVEEEQGGEGKVAEKVSKE